jgi:UDP-perosamine 4-acetyltransferase
MTSRSVVILGASGHAKVVLEAVQAMGCFTVVGMTDPSAHVRSLLGVPVLGGDDILPDLRAQGTQAAVVALGDNTLRHTLGLRMRELGFELPPVIHPEAFISPTAQIQDGAVIMARAVVGTASVVRSFAIVNTGAIIDHDNVIGEAAHVAPGCSLAGCVRIGDRALIGVGSSIRPKITVGADAIVGAGSAVVSDIPDRACVGGVPARVLRRSSAIAR